MLQAKRQGDADGVIHLMMAFKALYGVHPNPGVPGQVFPAPAQQSACLHTVPWGELMKDDLLIYGGAHCQRGPATGEVNQLMNGQNNCTKTQYSLSSPVAGP